jgi:uncharacterized protein
MAFDVYSATVPVFSRMLRNLTSHLEKAEAFAASRKYDPSMFLQHRLAPDMLPLVQQIQIACDTAKICCARVTSVEAPKFEDNEKTMAEIKARVAKTIDFLGSVPKEKFAGADTRPVTFNFRRQPTTAPGETYVLGHAIPNFFFHYTTAYALMRQAGVEIGKADYLGDFLP